MVLLAPMLSLYIYIIYIYIEVFCNQTGPWRILRSVTSGHDHGTLDVLTRTNAHTSTGHNQPAKNIANNVWIGVMR